MHGICELSLIPCRKDPSDRSELVTQLLFGEMYEVLEEEKKWLKIRTDFDRYECWISSSQFHPLSETRFSELSASIQPCCAELVQVLKPERSGSAFLIVSGSTLPEFRNGKCRTEERVFLFDGAVSGVASHKNITAGIVETAYNYLHSPYLWGGRSPFGIDCSGFIQVVFKVNGIKIPRDAWQQAGLGKTLDFVEESEAGDLAFFDNEEGKITHAGIVLSEKKIIHSSGRVRVDSLDHQGIYNPEQGSYSHKLRVLKRIVV